MKKLLMIVMMAFACNAMQAQDVVTGDASKMSAKELKAAAKAQKKKEDSVKDAAKARKKVESTKKDLEKAQKKAEEAQQTMERLNGTPSTPLN